MAAKGLIGCYLRPASELGLIPLPRSISRIRLVAFIDQEQIEWDKRSAGERVT
jgi:hypothetical protein